MVLFTGLVVPVCFLGLDGCGFVVVDWRHGSVRSLPDRDTIQERGGNKRRSESPETEVPEHPVDVASRKWLDSEGFWYPVDLACRKRERIVKASGRPDKTWPASPSDRMSKGFW